MKIPQLFHKLRGPALTQKPHASRHSKTPAAAIIPFFLLFLASCDSSVRVPSFALDAFHNASAPTLLEVAPPLVHPKGGDTLTLKGTGFRDGARIKVGLSDCEVTELTPEEIRCLMPAAAAGKKSVEVTNQDGQVGTLKDAVTISSRPRVTSLTPPSGPLAGKRSLLVAGEGFTQGTKIFLAGKPCRVTEMVSALALSCELPPGAAGKAKVTAVNEWGVECQECGEFRYNPPPTVVASTQSLSADRSTSMEITGTHFLAGARAFVGKLPCDNVKVVSPTKLQCLARGDSTGLKSVVVVNEDGQSAELREATEHLSSPTLLEVNPASGRLQGGEVLSFIGSNFREGLMATVGGAPCANLTRVNSSLLLCTSPPHPAGRFDVTLHDTSFTNKSWTFEAAFEYSPLPEISSSSPSDLKDGEATSITLSGKNFKAGSLVSVGSQPCADVELISSQALRCRAPALSAGRYEVSIVSPDTQSASKADLLRYVAIPVVSALSPTNGKLAGGETLTLTGQNFVPGVSVKLGSLTCSNVVLASTTSLTCQLPASSAGSFDVAVVDVFARQGVLPGAYTYNRFPVLTSVSPISGKTAGGTLLTFDGDFFLPGVSILFGDQACTDVTRLSANQVTCRAPAGSPGQKDVTVVAADGQRVTAANFFRYIPAPRVTSVSPTSGKLSGGTPLVVTGADFLASTRLFLGGQECASVTYTSTSQLTCNSIPSTATFGAVTVEARNGAPDLESQSGTLAQAYTFNEIPQITSVTPNNGRVDAPTDLVLAGSGFLAGAAVSVGASECQNVVVISAQEVRCRVLGGLEGDADVVLTNVDTQSATESLAFQFQVLPTLTGVSPASGALDGGNAIILTGTGFRPGATVAMVNTLVSPSTSDACAVTSQSSTSLTCTVPNPAGVAGLRNVKVVNPTGREATLANSYTYRSFPSIVSVTPGSGPSQGNTVLTIVGSDFIPGATVDVGGSACTVLTLPNPFELTCRTGVALSGGAKSVSVTNPDGQAATQIAAFDYYNPPSIVSLVPATGRLSGGQVLEINGFDFRTTVPSPLTVTIGASACTVLTVAIDKVTCTTPARATPGTETVTVTNSDGQVTFVASGFTYNAFPTLTSVTPPYASSSPGAELTLVGTGFLSGAQVSVGSDPCTVTSITGGGTGLVCTRGGATASGLRDVTITNADTQPATLTNALRLIDAPVLSAVTTGTAGASTPYVTAAGGTLVTLTGANFFDDGVQATRVRLGTTNCTSVSVVSPNATTKVSGTITCLAPTLATGAHNVTVENPDGLTSVLTSAVTATGIPTLSAVSPTDIRLAGGPLTLTGTGFHSGATVQVGGVACGSVTVASTTSLSCIAPSFTTGPSPGAKAVVVRNLDTQQTSESVNLTYHPEPTLTSVVSDARPSTAVSNVRAGGEVLRLQGSNFTGSASLYSVTVGASPCTSVTRVDDSTLTCAAPALTAGAKSVTVTPSWANSTAAVVNNALEYRDAPTVTSVSPALGNQNGGNTVTVTGTGFYAGTANPTVSIGTASCAPVTVVNPTTLTCVTSPLAPAAGLSVLVTQVDGQSNAANTLFEYLARPTLSAVVRHSTGTGNKIQLGGDTIRLTGTGYRAGATSVTVGGLACVPVSVTSNTQLTCGAPSRSALTPAEGNQSVVVLNSDGQDSAADVLSVRYMKPPLFVASGTKVTPASVPSAGGVIQLSSDAAYEPGETYTVTVGGTACTGVSVVNASTISCTAPALASSAGYNVTVADSYGQSATATASLAYTPVATVTSISPPYGSGSTSTAVRIRGNNFVSGLTASVAGVSCAPITNFSSTQFDCTVAGGAVTGSPGTVSVTNPNDAAGSLASAFEFLNPPTVTQVVGQASTSRVKMTGNSITLTGTNFRKPPNSHPLPPSGAALPSMTVSVGGQPCTSPNAVNGTTLTCTAPDFSAGAAGPRSITVTNVDGQTAISAVDLEYVAPPVLNSVSPTTLAQVGGFTLTLTGDFGTFATPLPTVNVGGSGCTSLVRVSQTTLTCAYPARTGGTYSVVVTDPYTQVNLVDRQVTYSPTPVISTLSLTSGKTAGGNSLDLVGANFQPNATVYLGTSICNVTARVSSTGITCTTTVSATSGAVNVVVTNDDGGSAQLTGGFTYVAPPTVASITPVAYGKLSGGHAITVVGTNFVGSPTVTIGDAACTTPVRQSATQITCSTPARAAGTYDVVVTNGDGDVQTGTLSSGYTYNAIPVVSSISPSSGTTGGGTTITVNGSGFLSGLNVRVGGANCTSLTLISQTQATCVTPAGSTGQADVIVYNLDTQNSTQAAGYTPVPYTYIAPPTISSVSPTNGKLAGGETLTITGSNFVTGGSVNHSVLIGSTPCNVTSNLISSTSIQCTVPANTAGVNSVVVTTPDNLTATLTNAYTYNPLPTITNVSPASGGLSGGTTLTIAGTGFLQSGVTLPSVTLVDADENNNVSCQSVVRVSASSLTCQTPLRPLPGGVVIRVGNPDGQLANSSTNAFTYIASPIVSSRTPEVSPLTGGASLTLSGSHFSTGSTVRVGTANCPVTSITVPTTIVCTLPSQIVAGNYAIQVSDTYGQTSNSNLLVTYNPLPIVSSVAPTNGVLAGGTNVTITGSFFQDTPVPTVFFGTSQCTSVTFVSSTSLQCTTGSRATPGSVAVAVTNKDGQVGSLSNGFRYDSAPAVASVLPASGALVGNQSVTISGTDFATSGGTPTVLFGASPCTAVAVQSATQLTCTTPSGTQGAVTVTVTNPDGQFGTRASGFTYNGIPTLSSVSPAVGTTLGGTRITLSGTGILAGASISVGGNPCTNPSVPPVNGFSISCDTPAGVLGAADIVLTNFDGQFASLLGSAPGFTYIAPPSVATVSPSNGTVAGGTTITIAGANFGTAPTVQLTGPFLGTVDCTVTGTPTDTSVQCVTPPAASQATTVTVRNTVNSLSGSLNAGFTYNPVPTVTSVSPAFGPTDQTTPITISGTNFISGATVKLGTADCTSVTFVSATSLTCTAPTRGSAGAVAVNVTNPDTQVASLASGFSYITPQADAARTLVFASSNKAPHNGPDVTLYAVPLNSSSQSVGNNADVRVYLPTGATGFTMTSSAGTCATSITTVMPIENWGACVRMVSIGGGVYTATLNRLTAGTHTVSVRIHGSIVTKVTATTTVQFDSANFTTIAADTSINTTNTPTPGTNLYVTSGNVTLESPGQVFGTIIMTGGRLLHPASTTGTMNPMRLSADALVMSGSASIDVTGLGYPQGYSYGNSAPSLALASTNGAGASHGGNGGYDSARSATDVGVTYGNPADPSYPGAGSSQAAGGGVVALNVTGVCQLGGTSNIKADAGGAGAAGGTVSLKCSHIGGNTSAATPFSANGGSANASVSGGGGGRILLETTQGAYGLSGAFVYPFDDASLLSFVTRVQARGGALHSTQFPDGGAGTLFLKHAGLTRGALVVDNARTSVLANSGKTTLPSVAGTSVTATGANVSISATHPTPWNSNFTGWLTGTSVRTDVTYDNGTPNNWTDDDVRTIQSHDETSLTLDANPASAVSKTLRSILIVNHLEILRGTTLESNGDIVVTDSLLSAPNPSASNINFLNASLRFNAGANIYPPLGALRLASGSFTFPALVVGNLSVEGATVTADSVSVENLTASSGTIITPSVTASNNITISGTASIVTETLTATHSLLMSGGTLSHPASTSTTVKKLVINVPGAPGTVTISGGKIDAKGKGYPSGFSFGSSTPSELLASLNKAGASHGGNGGHLASGQASDTGTVYGNYRNPSLPGAGGNASLSAAGGGVVQLTAAGGCTFSGGSVDADAAVGNGAGGSISLVCQSIAGTPTGVFAHAKGGDALDTGNPTTSYSAGGGGRVLLKTTGAGGESTLSGLFARPVDSASLSSLLSKVHAYGGVGANQTYPGGGAGTVFWKHSGLTYGALMVDNTPVVNYLTGGNTVLPSMAGTVSTTVSIVGSQLPIDLQSPSAISSAYANVYIGMELRPDVTAINGTAGNFDDDNVKSVTANTASILTLNSSTGLAAGTKFRSLDRLDFLDVGGASLVETYGDIQVSSGSFADNGNSLLLRSGLVIQTSSPGPNGTPEIRPASPTIILTSGTFRTPPLVVLDISLGGATLETSSLSATNVTLNLGTLKVGTLNVSGNYIHTNGTGNYETATVGGNFTFSGGILTHPASTPSATKKLVLNLTGAASTTFSGGTIVADGLGFPMGYSFGLTAPSTDFAAAGGAGGSHGGRGGFGAGTANDANATYGAYRTPTTPGAAGSNILASAGGGVVELNASGRTCAFTNGSGVSANGVLGGAGGSIALRCNIFSSDNTMGAIRANGGGATDTGVAGTSNAGGGGGRVALIATTNASGFGTVGSSKLATPTDNSSLTTLKSAVQARGGAFAASHGSGGAGTVFLSHSATTNGYLLIDNGSQTLRANSGRTPLLSLAGTVGASPSGNSLPVTSVTGMWSLDSRWNGMYAGLRLRPDLSETAATSSPLDFTDDTIVTVTDNTNSTFTLGSAANGAWQGKSFRSLDLVDRLEISGNAVVDSKGDIVSLGGTLASPGAVRLTLNNGVVSLAGGALLSPEKPNFTFSTMDYSVGTLAANDVTVSNSLLDVESLSARSLTVTGGTLSAQVVNLTNDLTLAGGVLTHPASSSSQVRRLELNVGGALSLTGAARIDVSSRGYPAGLSFGTAVPSSVIAAQGGAGASHGGMGGAPSTATWKNAGPT